MGEHWEYHVYWWDHQRESWHGLRGSPGIKAMLAAMGAERWELVSVTESPQTGYTFFFKRPAEPVVPAPGTPGTDGAAAVASSPSIA
ncbi:MAG TPA: hypothetical protein VLX59_12870 [Acidimicrobiales bacterium]|nr:hypothetical protein [Acidimicrobiales bacterium]